jgi:pimeloyl-ACP methyl ester carboxylesterase
VDPEDSVTTAGSYELDTAVALDVNGTRQRVRLCGARAGSPPVLIVQAGPGFPLLNEIARFQQGLQLEQDFSVAYWDQRGCGRVPVRDAQSVSLETQVTDLLTVIRWVATTTRQPVVLLAISLGATIALQAAARDSTDIGALVLVSLDADISASDTAVFHLLQEVASQGRNPKMARRVSRLGPPPYATPAQFQLRMRLLTDLGGIERGRGFAGLMWSSLASLIRTYGWIGAMAALRNMNTIQRRVLLAMPAVNLFRDWPRPAAAVHYVFGERDPLVPRSLVQQISNLAGPADTVLTVPGAGHMVHFDEPAVVRSVVARARVMHDAIRSGREPVRVSSPVG